MAIPVQEAAAVKTPAFGDGGSYGKEIFWVGVTAAFFAALMADHFFDQFDFCPVCGGSGKTPLQFIGSRNITTSPCPLLFLKPDWHQGTLF